MPNISKIRTNILKERNSPLEQTFHFLCSKAGYKSTQNPLEIDSSEINDLLKNNDDVDCSFNDINIDDIDIDEIKDQIYSYNCTFENKLKLQKYYFINKFIPETPIQEIAKAWDGRHQSILDALSELYHRDNIFKEIQEYNQWDTLIDPEKFQKVEFSDDIRMKIFKQFHFKDLQYNSKPFAIYKNIINAYFNKKIITSNKKGTHYIHEVDPKCINMIDFGLKYLINYNYNKKNEDLFIEYEQNIYREDDDEPEPETEEPEPETEEPEEDEEEINEPKVEKGRIIIYWDD